MVFSVFESLYLKYLNINSPNVNLSLKSQTKCYKMFSDPELDHIFPHFSVTYLDYTLFLLVCCNYSITLKRGRYRNLLYVVPRLNQIHLSTNIISLPMQREDTDPNSKYYLEKYFNIA